MLADSGEVCVKQDVSCAFGTPLIQALDVTVVSASITWAQPLKRVFNVNIEVCGHRGGSVKIIACIEDQDIIDRILAHLRVKE
jgi:hypothetical protein